MLEVLKDLGRKRFTSHFHAARQQASGLENFEVIRSDFNPGFTQRVHDLPTEALPLGVRTEFHPVASALKDSASLVWDYFRDRSFSSTTR